MPAGRPTVMTKETLEILDRAWLAKATVEEAALLAGISEDTIYNYKKENPEYSEKIARLKGLSKLHAKMNINEEICNKKNIGLSTWLLEKTDDEYNPKKRTELSGSVTLNPHSDMMDRLKDLPGDVATAVKEALDDDECNLKDGK